MRHPAFADRLQPRPHQFVIRARGAEPEQAFGRARLQFRRNRGQAVEQLAVGLHAAFFLDRHEKLRQFVLDPADRHGQALRDRQAEQRQHAVGFDFQQPLRQRARAFRRQRLVDHQKAHEAEGVGGKIAGDGRPALVDGGGGDRGAGEQADNVLGRVLFGDQMQVGGDKQGAGLRQQAHDALQFVRRRPEWFGPARKAPAIGDEFAMPLENQARGREIEPDLFRAGVRRRQAARAGKIHQRLDGFCSPRRIRGEGEEQHAAGRFRPNERPRVDFAQRRRSQFMRFETVSADHSPAPCRQISHEII